MKRLRIALLVLTMLVASMSMTACTKKEKKIENKNPSSVASQQPSSKPSSIPSSEPPAPSSEPMSEPDEDVVANPLEARAIDIASVYTTEDKTALEQLDNESIGWGQGVRVDELNRPVTCDPAQSKYEENGGLFIMPADEKKMYLTFDEGYEAGYTGQILDALKEKDAKGVFFVTLPYVKANPELVQRMIDEGNIVGNHSARHKVMPTLTIEECVSEIAELHNYMVENFNYQMTLFRPPEGKYSTRTMQIAKDMGYKTVLWSFAYKDYDTANQMGVDLAFPKVTKMAHPGAIYLLHAVSKDNADMMGDLIDYFRGEGYELAPLA